MPMLGAIFLRLATNRYDDACLEIAREQSSDKCPSIGSTTAILRHRALILCNEARYHEFVRLQ
jgi:hypothetical protein